jgi:nucleoid-associated protein YgaU
VKRIVDGAVALTVATASIAGPVAPAIAQTPEPVVITVDDAGRPVPPGVPDGDEDTTDEAPDTDDDGRVSIVTPGLDRIGWTPRPAGVASSGQSTMSDAVDSLRDAVGTQEPGAAEGGFAQITVARGDHLWSISEGHLTDAVGDTPTDAEIARYWRRVIDANRDRLRSGDPDLIYPGETVRLPPIHLEDEQP